MYVYTYIIFIYYILIILLFTLFTLAFRPLFSRFHGVNNYCLSCLRVVYICEKRGPKAS
jgi:hypothetical protein